MDTFKFKPNVYVMEVNVFYMYKAPKLIFK